MSSKNLVHAIVLAVLLVVDGFKAYEFIKAKRVKMPATAIEERQDWYCAIPVEVDDKHPIHRAYILTLFRIKHLPPDGGLWR